MRVIIKAHTIEEQFIHEGLLCVVVLTGRGHRCGYVGLPPEHIHYGKNLEYPVNIYVHGGVTYCCDNSNSYPIDTNPKYWFVGFDCAHACDAEDFDEADKYFGGIPIYERRKLNSLIFKNNSSIIRTKGYVREECMFLAEQINKLPEILVIHN